MASMKSSFETVTPEPAKTFGNRVVWDHDILILPRDVPIPPAPCLFCAGRDHIGEWTPTLKGGLAGNEEIRVRFPRCGPCADRMTTATMGTWIAGGFAALALPIAGWFAVERELGVFVGLVVALIVNALLRGLCLNRAVPYGLGFDERTLKMRVPSPALTREALALMRDVAAAELQRADAARILVDGRILSIPIDAQLPARRCIVCAGIEGVRPWNRKLLATIPGAWAVIPVAALLAAIATGWWILLVAGCAVVPFARHGRWMTLPYCARCRDRAESRLVGAIAATIFSFFFFPVGLPAVTILSGRGEWASPAVGAGLIAAIGISTAIYGLWVRPNDVTCAAITGQFTHLRVPDPAVAAQAIGGYDPPPRSAAR